MINYPFTKSARKSGSGWTDLCPAHADRSHSLSVNYGRDGKLLLHCFAGCSFSSILAAAGLRQQQPRVIDEPVSDHRDGAAQRTKIARRLWGEGGAVAGTLSERYLASRGLTLWSDHQRHHPALWHGPSGKCLPALISPIICDEKFVGIHRIFLNRDGTKLEKMMLGGCRGGHVPLFENGPNLIVAEGVETAIAMQIFTEGQRWSVWSAMSASGVENLILPKVPGELVVASDGDTRGYTASSRLAERAARSGWKASVLAADEHKDWNDMLLECDRHVH